MSGRKERRNFRRIKSRIVQGTNRVGIGEGAKKNRSQDDGLTRTYLSTGAINQDKCISLAMIADRDDKFPGKYVSYPPGNFHPAGFACTQFAPLPPVCNFPELNNFPFAAWRRFAARASRNEGSRGAVLMIIGRAERWSISGME